MKFAVLLSFLLFYVGDTISQDLIITNSGDTINCAITYRSKKKIFYTHKTNTFFKSTSIRKKNVQRHEVSFYSDSITGEFLIVNIPETQQYRVGLSFGYSNAAPISYSDLVPFPQFERNINKGIQFSGDFTYFYRESSGVGLVMTRFGPSTTNNSLAVNVFGHSYINMIAKDKMSVTFIAPSYTTRSVSYDNRSSAFLNVAIGYVRFKNEFEFFEKSTMTANSLGFRGGIGFDQHLTEHLKIGFEASCLLTGVGSIKLANDGKFNTVESSALRPTNLSRLDASIGLRYYW